MICLRCNSEEFDVKPDTEMEQEFRGEMIKVTAPAMECVKCGWRTLALDQADELRKRTADAYRRKHRLLTSEQIKAVRRVLRMSQRQFAEFLRVGEASVKRWETWQVQDASSDELIRVKAVWAKWSVRIKRLRASGRETAVSGR
jgi:putative zinc finger/helix-turn-helix YgiT family protein